MLMLRKWVLKNELPLIGILALFIFAIWIATWHGTLVHLGQLRAIDSLTLFEDRLKGEIRRVEAAARAAESITLENPLDEEHSGGLESILPFLDHSGALTNLILWRNNGRSASILRTEQGWDLLLVYPERFSLLYTLRGSQRVLIKRQPHEERPYLVLERPWFKFGSRRTNAAWMPERYKFWDSEHEGMSYVSPIRSGKGELLGMVCADLQVNTLNGFVKSLPPREGSNIPCQFSDGSPLFTLQSTSYEPATTTQAPGARLLQFLRPDLIPIEAEHSTVLAGEKVNLKVQTTTGALLPRLHLLFWGSLLATELLFVGFALSMSRLHEGLFRPLLSLLDKRKFTQATAEGNPRKGQILGIWEISQIAQRVLSAERIESERDQLLKQFERIQRVESVGEMAAGYVHDASNLLTLSLSHLDLCLEATEGESGLTDSLKKAETAITACSRQLQRLLAYSGRTSGSREEVDLNALCGTVGSMLEPALGKEVHLQFRLAPDLPKVHGDPIQLEQALINLLLNARDAMPDGGAIYLRTSLQPQGPSIEVCDEGPGVPPGNHSRIFEPFFTTKGPEKGTGLGLFMVSSIMKAHGGRVEVATGTTEGACFRLLFSCPELDYIL